MKTILKALIPAIAMMTALPASASTLVLFDFNAAEGDRITSSPYVDQEIDRMVRQGLLRPIPVHMDDGGTQLSTDVDVVLPANIPPQGLGVRILTGGVTWRITTQRNGDQFSYEAVIRTSQGFSNGIGPSTQNSSSEATLVGVANIENEGRPAFARRYTTPGGARMLVGIVTP